MSSESISEQTSYSDGSQLSSLASYVPQRDGSSSSVSPSIQSNNNRIPSPISIVTQDNVPSLVSSSTMTQDENEDEVVNMNMNVNLNMNVNEEEGFPTSAASASVPSEFTDYLERSFEKVSIFDIPSPKTPPLPLPLPPSKTSRTSTSTSFHRNAKMGSQAKVRNSMVSLLKSAPENNVLCLGPNTTLNEQKIPVPVELKLPPLLTSKNKRKQRPRSMFFNGYDYEVVSPRHSRSTASHSSKNKNKNKNKSQSQSQSYIQGQIPAVPMISRSGTIRIMIDETSLSSLR